MSEYDDPFWDEIPEIVACYTRFSTDMQTVNSTKRQLIHCTAYARTRGWPDPVHFLDEAESGRKIKREGLDRLWDFCRKHPDTPVIIENVSRLARGAPAFAHAVLNAEATGAVFYDAGKGYLDPPELHYRCAQALEEQKTIVNRFRDGLCIAFSNGVWKSRPPYGYMKDEHKRLMKDPDTAPIAQEILETLADGARPADIARDLTRRGIPTPTGEAEWGSGSIIMMASNRIYVGEQVSRRPILEEERRRRNRKS
jgi:site-specific DNA recombinase